MIDSKTPRTDAYALTCSSMDEDDIAFMRQLETELTESRAKAEENARDAERWNAVVELAKCDENNPMGLCASASSTKAAFAFRYWCDVDTLTRLIDSAIAQKK